MPQKILILDDSSISREVARFALESVGYDVVEIDSPFGLSSALQAELPDLVLLDVQMPSLNGDKAVEIALRNGLHRCPLVLYSDRPEAELRALVKSSGASGYVRKTGDMAVLLRSVVRFLDAPSS